MSQIWLICASAGNATLRSMEIRCGLRVPVYDLGCGGGGATTLERELAAAEGVLRACVNPATETAYIDYDPSETGPSLLIEVIERAGYRAGRPVEA